MVMSSPFAGAEMMTFFAPPSMCLRRIGRASVKRPVDSSTMSTPRSFHGSFAGSFSAKTLISSPSTVIAVGVGARRRRRYVAVHRVVLEEVRERLRVGEVVHGDEVEVGDALLLRGAEDLPPDAAEAVDADANGHASPISCMSEQPVARQARARPKVT